MFFVLVRNIDNAMQGKKLCKIARALNSTAISKYVTLKMTDVPSKHAWKIKKLKKVVMFIRISFCLSQSNVYSISSGNIETNCYPRFSLSFIVARRSRSLICCVILLFTQGRLDSLFLTGFFRRSLICCAILLFTQGRLDSLFLTGFFRIGRFYPKLLETFSNRSALHQRHF